MNLEIRLRHFFMFILRRRSHPLAKHFNWHFHLSPLLFTPVKKIEIKINLLCIYHSVIRSFSFCHSIIFILSFNPYYHSIFLMILWFDYSYHSVIQFFLFCHSIFLIIQWNYYHYHSIILSSYYSHHSVIRSYFILSFDHFYSVNQSLLSVDLSCDFVIWLFSSFCYSFLFILSFDLLCQFLFDFNKKILIVNLASLQDLS